jgi:RHS repeat-associated protein
MGSTSTLFDALGRPTRITKQDNSVSTLSYFGPCATTTDEAGKARRACSDGAGRVTEVDEPGDSSAPASNIPGSSASVVIGGPGEQSKFIPAPRPTPCHPVNLCPPPDRSGGSDTTFYDAGTVYVTANGHTDQVPYGQGDTFQTIAANLASVINADGSASVTAQASGSTITLYPRSSATNAYFSVVCPATTWDSGNFASPSFTTTCTGAAPVFSGHAYVTLYSYDPLGNLLCVEQHGNVSGTGCSAAPSSDATSPWRVRRFTYDSLSRMLSATNPESGQIIYQYNASGDLISKTDARSVTVNYSPSDMPIDPLHRVREKIYSNNDPAVTFLYDQAENGIGRLAATSNGSMSAAYAYDPMGRIKNQTYCFPSTCADSLPVSAKYDQAGNMTQLTYPSGRGINYFYNPANLLNSVQFALWNGAAPQYGVYSYMSVDDADFLPSGLPARTVLGNGITATQAQNNRLQLASESTVGAGNLVFEGHAYTYGSQNNGNILGITDQLNSSRNQTFTYDALNRLYTANEGRWGLGFVYDPWGNRLQQNLTAGTAGQSQLVVNVNNRVNGYSFDSDGNMLNDGFHQYAYDGENRIATVDTTAAVYTYGPGGERMRKDAAGVGTKYLYFNGSVIAEKDVTTGNWSDYVFAGGKRIARATNFEHQLHIGGVECANCGWQWYQFIVNNLGLASGHTIQAGDKLRWSQWQNTGSAGGIIITFTDGTDSCCSSGPILSDQNGDQIARTSVVNRWDYRIANLDPVVGKTISQIRLYADGTTQPGQWDIYFQDLVFTGADGSIQPLYSQNATLPSLTGFGSAGMTQTSATIHDCVGAGCAPINTTTYYHGDQIDSSRLLTNGTGYPVWQGTFLPFGEEYNAEATTNHYKFTSKERDSESGLDYFGRRYYASLLGRWTGGDPINFSTKHILRPQRWNKYTYVENDPLGSIDPDGNEDYKIFLAAPEAGGNWDKAKSVAQAYGHTLEVFRGKDATVQNFNAMSMDRDNRVVVVGHTSHLPSADATPGATVSINLSNGRSAGSNSVTQQVENGNVQEVPNPPTLVNADTVALFGCNSIDLSKDFSGASNFVGLSSGTDHLSTFTAMNAAAETFVEADAAARPAGAGGAVSDATVNASNQAFQNNRAVGDQGVGTDFDGDKVKKDDKQPK